MPGLAFFQPAMIASSAGMPVMSGAKFDTYEPGALNCDGAFEPSPPNTFAFLPCSTAAAANVCAAGGFCVGKKTMSASLGTFVTYDE